METTNHAMVTISSHPSSATALAHLGMGQQLDQNQQHPAIMRRLSAPPLPPSSSLYLAGNNFSAGHQFGRVPNFSSHYLSSLNNATTSSSGGFESQGHQASTPLSLTPPQQQQMTTANGGQASPSTSDQSGRSLAGGGNNGADAFLSGATIVTNPASSYAALPVAMSAAGGAGCAGGATAGTTPPAVVTNNVPSEIVTTAKKNYHGGGVVTDGARKSPSTHNHKRDRRHSIPTSILLSPSQQRQQGGGVASGLGGGSLSAACQLPPSHPVPEFLCHLYSMLNDPALSPLIGWIVPPRDETTDLGGGKAGVGKIVVHDPTRLQNEVLGKYYRHSKYSSFQRQLNYFGFKKRLHGSKKGKMCPCSFVHDTLGANPASLLNLKRRPPSGKRVGSEPNLLAGAAGSKAAHGGGLPSQRSSKKENGRRGSLPKNVSIGSTVSSINATMASLKNVNANKGNATWVTAANNNIAQGAAPAPLSMMPTMAQVTATFPSSWSMPSNNVVDVVGNNINGNPNNNAVNAPSSLMFFAADMINSSGARGTDRSDELLRANNAVLEAKKSLARNFLKSQREAQRNGGGADFRAADAGPACPRQKPQPQQQQPSVQRSNVQIQQQQHHPPQQMAMPAPNRFPNPFATLTMSDFNRVQQPTQQPPTITHDTWMGQPQQQQEPLAKLTPLPAKTIAFPTNFIATNSNLTQANAATFISAFPDKNPIVVNNTNLVGSLSSGAASTTSTASTNNLMVPEPPSAKAATAGRDGGSGGYESPPGMTDTPEIQFNELLSNLLSTALPPSEELFDDDMSAGNISDFGLQATALQVADDGMLLPE